MFSTEKSFGSGIDFTVMIFEVVVNFFWGYLTVSAGFFVLQRVEFGTLGPVLFGCGIFKFDVCR
jgi:hypothetical protein